MYIYIYILCKGGLKTKSVSNSRKSNSISVYGPLLRL